MEVRAAVQEDAPAVGEVHAEAWRVGFSDLFAPGWLRGAVEERRQRWESSLAGCLVGRSELLVAESDGRVIGFVQYGPSEEAAPAGEVFALYVHPNHWGSGAARMLSQQASGDLGARGFERIVLWTLAAAERARGFYCHNGWVVTGRSAERDFGDGRLSVVVEYSLEPAHGQLDGIDRGDDRDGCAHLNM